jgi:DNA-binding SARP family transcriptional activator/TolB-like protein/Tfp pilus assembly protein PilF
MTFAIGILGPLTLDREALPVGHLPRKARALLGYLAAHGGRAVSREFLADLLWPHQGPRQARHSLRTCLLQLRKALGPSAAGHLVIDGTECRLADVGVDADRFEGLSRSRRRSDLREAAELYRGEFLTDCTIDSEPYQEWLVAARERNRALAAEILQRLCGDLSALGETDAAIAYGRRLVALDPLSEVAHRTLMRAYAEAGRRPEALRQFKSCAAILKRDLGVAPDAETQALVRAIVRSRLANPAPAGTEGSGRDSDANATPLAAEVPLPGARRSQAVVGSTERVMRWPCLISRIAVAVTPLRNLTGDQSRQYLVDGLSDDLVTELTQKRRRLALARVTEDRGSLTLLSPAPSSEVGFAVAGSVQGGGPGILRVNMRITDAVTSEVLWSSRYELSSKSAPATQGKITGEIARELHFLLLQRASRRAARKFDRRLGVSECLSRAAAALGGRITPEVTAEAQEWLLAGLALDPRNVTALVALGRTCQNIASAPWWSDPGISALAANIGRAALATALELAPGHADAHCIDGMMSSAAGDLENAAEAFARALAADPGLATAHGFAGYNLAFLGRAAETGAQIERAMRLDRTDRPYSVWFFFAGFAELLLGHGRESVGLFEKSLERNPDYGCAQLFLAAALAACGRRREATRAAAAFRTRYPRYHLNAFEQQWLSRSQSRLYRSQINPVYETIRSLGAVS